MLRRAVVLLSGGLDSSVSLAWAREQGYECSTLSVDYGQRHRIELERASTIAAELKVKDHRIIKIDLRSIGGSALNSSLAVPKHRTVEQLSCGVPITYVPARNTILLSVALGYAETIQAFDLVFGANRLDYSGYPDCRPAFFQAFTNLANLATKLATEGHGAFQIHTPLIDLSKAEIIRMGVQLGLNLALTTSCYDPDEQGRACGACDACLLRRAGFLEANIPDPTIYQTNPLPDKLS